MMIFVLMAGLFSFKVTAQETYKLEELFMDAESWFYFQDYKNSLPLYKQVHQAFPGHDNVNFKIGFCYLNIDGKKDQAIPYLKKAADNTTFNYNREAFYQRKAPVDAIFYLGNAYLVNNKIDSALQAYRRFKQKIEGKRGILNNQRDFDFDYLEKQIQVCQRAKEAMADPVSYAARNVGMPVNTPLSEYNPVISGDGQMMVYTAEKKFYTGVFMSQKKDGEWGPPVNLLPQLGVDGDIQTCSISPDGKELYLYREDDLDGNLYVSSFKEGEWSEIRKLGPNINTEYWESHAFISHDTQKLYFTSNRPGGYGDLDIWVSKRKNDSTWGKPENLGPTVNTPWREDTPFLTRDGQALFFSSEGHYSLGGYDIMVARKKGDQWGKPQNLGYPINTTDHDQFFHPIKNGRQAYYARYHDQSPGARDIFRYRIDGNRQIDYLDVEGVLTYKTPAKKERKSFTINVIDQRSQDTLLRLNPNDSSKKYDFQLNAQTNHLILETPRLSGNKQFMISQKINIKEKAPQKEMLASREDTAAHKQETEDQEMAARQEVTGDTTSSGVSEPSIDLREQMVTARADQQHVKIKLNLQGGKKLKVNTFQDDTLINTETFPVEQGEFTYQYQPGQQQTRLSFELTNDQDQRVNKTVNIRIDSLLAGQSPERDSARLKINEKTFHLSEGKKKVRINLSLEKGSRLIVATYVNSELINREEFNISSEDFTYEFEPRQQESTLNFKVIDDQHRVKTKRIVLSHQPINKELEDLLTNLERHQTDLIGQKLAGQEKEKISARGFFASLYETARKQTTGKQAMEKLDAAKIDALLYATILLDNQDISQLLSELTRMAEGKLKSYLKNLSVGTIDSKRELISQLRAAAGKPSYTVKQLRDVLLQYVDQTYPPDQLYHLTMNLSRLETNKILSRLGEEALDIVTTADMIRYLKQSDLPNKMKMLALLQGTKLSGVETGSDLPATFKADQTQEAPGRDTSSWVYYLGAGAVLVVILLFLLRRRNRKRNSESN